MKILGWICAAFLLTAPFFTHSVSFAGENSVSAEWLENVPRLGKSKQFMASNAPHRANVVFFARQRVTDFKVLALDFKEFDKNSKPVFSIKELYTLKTLEPDCPLVVGLEFIGSIPNNGISYKNSKGKTVRFTLEQSGMDGSAILSEF